MGQMDSEHSNHSDVNEIQPLDSNSGHQEGKRDFQVENSLRKSPRIAAKIT